MVSGGQALTLVELREYYNIVLLMYIEKVFPTFFRRLTLKDNL